MSISITMIAIIIKQIMIIIMKRIMGKKNLMNLIMRVIIVLMIMMMRVRRRKVPMNMLTRIMTRRRMRINIRNQPGVLLPCPLSHV